MEYEDRLKELAFALGAAFSVLAPILLVILLVLSAIVGTP